VRFSDLDGATIGVWGVGTETRSFAAQLRRRLPDARIAAIVQDTAPAVDPRAALDAPEALVAIGSDAAAALARCDVVVRSPGVSIHRPELAALRARVVTPTGLWLAEREGRGVVGITGTKGKSTTAALAFHLATAAGVPVHLAGNIGEPALDLLDAPADDLAIVELSSYQIADLETGPEVAVVTSLFPEHRDWHGSEERYREDKLRVLGLPGVRAAVVNGRDARLVAAAPGAVRYGVPGGWDVVEGGVAAGGEVVVPRAELPLRGMHHALTLCAALAALETFGLALPPLPEALRGFRGLPHRLEVVSEQDGIVWVDDSISTTPESAIAALESFPDREIVLIGGGQDRGQDYAELARVLTARNAIVIGLPSTGARLVETARAAGIPPERAFEAGDLPAAVAHAQALSTAGSAVLLSPAAPSYDTYRNFEERGDHFRTLVSPDPRD
jgi:UDP-N-acetylmuramoyl-L-alanine---L-glutamate ligase